MSKISIMNMTQRTPTLGQQIRAKKRFTFRNWFKHPQQNRGYQRLSAEEYKKFESQNIHRLIMCAPGSREKISLAYAQAKEGTKEYAQKFRAENEDFFKKLGKRVKTLLLIMRAQTKREIKQIKAQ